MDDCEWSYSINKSIHNMTDINQVTQVAKGVSDYGMMAVTAAFFLVLSALMMVALFRWFRAIIEQVIADQKKGMNELADETRKQNEMLQDISDGLRPETLLRIRNLTGFASDLSIENVCLLIKRVRKENQIADHEATAYKIRKSLLVIHNDRNSRLDSVI